MVITDVNQVVYQGDGATTAFPFTFRIIDATDIKLLLIDADGTETDITSDYFVDTVNNTVHYPGYAPGAEPPLADRPAPVQMGQRLVVYRELPVTQEKDLGEKWPFFVIELALDKLTMILQQIYEWWGRTLRISEGDKATHPDFDMTFPIEPGKSFRVNMEGTGFEASADPGPYAEIATEAATTAAAAAEAAAAAAAGVELQAQWYDSVADMRSANIPAGITAGTKGYYSVNDGGSAMYIIREKMQSDVDDGSNVIFINNGNVAEKLGEEINPDQFPGVTDAIKLQNAIDYAITKKSATITIKRKYDITGSTLYINKGYGRTSLRQHLIFMGTGSGEIYKGDSGYIFSGNHSPEGANFTAGDVCFMHITFRGANDIPPVADKTSLCSVFDVSKILRITSINNSFSAVNKVFDGTLSASQSTTMQQVYTFGDLCTDSYCYIYMGTTYALYVHCATVERCVYGVTNHVNDSGFMYMTSIHFRDCVIEGCSSGGIKIVEGSTPSAYALTNFTVDGCYFETNGSENLVIHVTFARNIKITNNKFTMNANSTDLWVTSDDWILDGNLNYTTTATGTYMFNISNTPSSNIKIVTRNNEINAQAQQLTNKPEVIITGDKIDNATMTLSPIGQGSVFFDRCGRLVMVKFGNINNLPAGRTTLDNTIPIKYRPIDGVVYTLSSPTMNILVFLNTDGTIIVHNRGSAISSSTPVYDTFWYFV